MISSNRRTKLIISRLLTAVFLFVILCTPLSALAAGESVSDNGSDEEYESWDDALADSDYADNLAEVVTDYWITTWLNYVGTGAEVAEDVADLLGNQYDATKDLYDNLVPYILPIATTTISNIPQNSITDSIYGKPIRNKNNIKLINDIVKDVTNNVDSSLSGKANDSKQKQYYQSDIFPSWFYFALSPIVDPWPNHPDPYDEPYNTTMYIGREWVNNGSDAFQYTIFHCTASRGQLTYYGSGYGFNYNYINDLVNLRYERWKNKNGSWHEYYGAPTDGIVLYGWAPSTMSISWIKVSGNTYIYHNTNGHFYYWDQTSTTLYDLGLYSDFDDAQNNGGATVIHKNTINIVNSVDFTEYNDLINDLLIDVNMSNNVTNSLLYELLLELRTQNNNYVQNDGDDIYDYIDYMMDRLTEVKDVHIEIPDITPDLGGIATALSALLNFLASIIRAIGDIVSSLLDGLFHLFVPTTDQWAELTLDFDTVMNPFRWIRGFLGEGVNAVSTCLFGSNVTDITSASDELETVNASVAATRGEPSEHSSSHANIVYDEETGAPKIPVHFSNSTSEYFSDIGDAYIIDMNWYAPFKPVGDVIVVAFCWIMFIWRVIRDLPGIINGTSGITDNNPDTYSGEVNKQSTWNRISGR